MARKTATKKNTEVQTSKGMLPDGLINEAPVVYPLATTSIVAEQLYSNPERRPNKSGPWDNEADKVAWVDEATGFGCIMLRQTDGTLSGYVGIGPDHPLYGFKADAVPLDISTTIHGGLTYGKACEANRVELHAKSRSVQERYSVCHVTRTRTRVVHYHDTVQTTEDEFHEDLWWVGFDTNHDGDVRPNDPRYRRRTGDVYRDQSFVYAQCMALAQCLQGVANQVSGSEPTPRSPLLEDKRGKK